MGLTIAYRLGLPAELPRESVVERIRQLRDGACRLPFDVVTHVFECMSGDTVGTMDNPRNNAEFFFRTWAALALAADSLEDPGELARLPDAIGFIVGVGKECEPAIVGVTWTPPLDDDWSPVRGHPCAWNGMAMCKTQYASIVSDEHFIRCHTSIVALLDEAVKLGFSVVVSDEGGFWESRDPDRLLAAVGSMNRLVARFGGALHDAIGEEHAVESPIFAHPDFERLETEPLAPPANGADP